VLGAGCSAYLRARRRRDRLPVGFEQATALRVERIALCVDRAPEVIDRMPVTGAQGVVVAIHPGQARRVRAVAGGVGVTTEVRIRVGLVGKRELRHGARTRQPDQRCPRPLQEAAATAVAQDRVGEMLFATLRLQTAPSAREHAPSRGCSRAERGH
jgi:hypothetical protein